MIMTTVYGGKRVTEARSYALDTEIDIVSLTLSVGHAAEVYVSDLGWEELVMLRDHLSHVMGIIERHGWEGMRKIKTVGSKVDHQTEVLHVRKEPPDQPPPA